MTFLLTRGRSCAAASDEWQIPHVDDATDEKPHNVATAEFQRSENDREQRTCEEETKDGNRGVVGHSDSDDDGVVGGDDSYILDDETTLHSIMKKSNKTSERSRLLRKICHLLGIVASQDEFRVRLVSLGGLKFLLSMRHQAETISSVAMSAVFLILENSDALRLASHYCGKR